MRAASYAFAGDNDEQQHDPAACPDGGVRMSIQMDFTGKRVWVTGAARGIGEQIARHF